MKVDYHLHPNLSSNPKRRLRAIWRELSEHRIDAIVCAEHDFKDAPHAYRTLTAARPHGASTHVFPGAELRTNDGKGIDVIAFAEHDWYDDYPELLQAYSMSLREMLTVLERSGLRYFIPHPFIIGSPLPKRFSTEEEMDLFFQSIPAFEAHNGAFLLLEHFFQYPALKRLSKRLRYNLRTGAAVDLEKYRLPHHSFLAVGSDAHHPWEIGFSVEIPSDGMKSRREIFEILTSNTEIQTLHFPQFQWVVPRLLATALTILHESIQCHVIGWKRKIDAFFEEESLVLDTEIPAYAEES